MVRAYRFKHDTGNSVTSVRQTKREMETEHS